MSWAIDTIKQAKILDMLHQADYNNDKLHLVRLLLADTKLNVNIKSTHSAEFKTSIGSPQGDGLSPMLFTCYLDMGAQNVNLQASHQTPSFSCGDAIATHPVL